MAKKEVTIEMLQAENEALKAELVAKNEELTKIESLETESKALKAELEEKNALINELRATPPSGEKTFEHGGKTYKVKTGKFSFEGETVTADQLCENTEMQKALIEIEAGFIEEVAE